MLGINILADGTIVYSAWLISLLIVSIIWELVWKALGIWRAGRRNQPIWFILILILNTVGILPIIYLVISSDKGKKKSNKKK